MLGTRFDTLTVCALSDVIDLPNATVERSLRGCETL